MADCLDYSVWGLSTWLDCIALLYRCLWMRCLFSSISREPDRIQICHYHPIKIIECRAARRCSSILINPRDSDHMSAKLSLWLNKAAVIAPEERPGAHCNGNRSTNRGELRIISWLWIHQAASEKPTSPHAWDKLFAIICSLPERNIKRAGLVNQNIE